jgi:uncharacterized protein YecT (DUF1311 family)
MRLCPIIVLLAILAGPAMAADCPGQTQSDLNMCADQALRTVDAALNASYKAILGRLKQNDGTRNKLVAAERAWLGFRDAECAFVAAGVQGGSIEPMIELNCRANLTKRRQKDLDGYLSCQEGDLTCPVPPG